MKTLITKLKTYKHVSLAVVASFGLSTTCSGQFSPVFTNLWNLQAGALADLPTSGNNVRGIAINPVTGNLLYASTAGGNHVTVVERATGNVLGALDGTTISGGTLALVPVRVAEDGAVYAANLAAASSTLKVYRWPSETEGLSSPPTVIYEEAGVAARFGDAMDVRGAGTNTQIVIVGNGSTRYKLLYPSEETLTNAYWTSVEFSIPNNGNYVGRGVTFDGTNDAIFGKTGGNGNIYKIGFDVALQTNWIISTIATGDNSLVGVYYLKTNGVELISGVTYSTTSATNATTHRAKVFQLSGISNATLVLDQPLPEPYFGNGNGIGVTAIAPGLVAFCEPNNSIPAYSVDLSAAVPPAISSSPVSETNVLEGGYYTISGAATGTEPLRFQWLFNGSPLAGQTTSSLALTDISAAQAGFYSLRVTNLFGTATSEAAYVGVAQSVRTSTSHRDWAKRPGDLFFLTADNTQRGMAYNPVSGNVLVVSRTPSNGVYVVDGNTGAYLRSLDMTGVGGVQGSVYDVNMIAVADDGAVYVCDLTTSGDGFAIYRWANDAAGTVPAQVFIGNPGVGRVGDTLSVAGRGVGTTLFAASRSGTQVAVFITYDELYWFANVVDVTEAPAGFAGLGLYATSTNTFWGKAPGFSLRKVEFDLMYATNGVTATLNAGVDTINNIGVDQANGLVFGVTSFQTPDNLAIYDVYGMSTTNDSPVIIDQEFFASDNQNLNGTGQVAVDLSGGRIFALNSNNGLIGLTYAPPLRWELTAGQLMLDWFGPAILQSASDVTGPYTDVPNVTTRPYTATASPPVFYRLRR